MDRCADQYRCATALYLLSILAHAYDIIIYHGVGAPGHATNKQFLSLFIATAQLTGASDYYSHMAINTSTMNTATSIAR